MTARRPPLSLLALSLTLAMTGCSRKLDDLPREPVAGTVTMDNQPLPEAVIQFYPQGESSATSTGANAEIKDGRFSIPRESGLVPGTYKVSISHAELTDIDAKGKNRRSTPTRSKKLGPEQIPARYNAKSELKVEIKSGGATDLKYELQSK
jgi:hypothetical protein